MKLPGWTREPLVHFLVAGLLLFVLFAWRGEPVDPASRVIDVGQEELAQLALQFERTLGRPPTDAELDAAIQQYVRDEILYREALRLGLDQGDAVVRRRLVTKMDLSASASVEVVEPDEATLRAFFDENRARYAGAASVSFEQRYFADRSLAERSLAGNGEPTGQAISLPASLEGLAMNEVEARFGAEFASALASIEPQEGWQGPVQSGFGWHLVRLNSRELAETDFEALQSRVENDWRSAEIVKRKDRAFDVLREAYRVDIDR